MCWDELLERIVAFPQWATVSIVAWAARLVEPNFRCWMRERVYISGIDSALNFAERCVVEGGDTLNVPINLPKQIALITDAASAAARSTWEDDLDPDATPSGYSSSAYAAAEAAAAVSALLKGLAFGLWEHQKRNLIESLTSSLASAKHNAASDWAPSYEAYKAAEAKGEADFTQQLTDQVSRIEDAVSAGLTGSTGIPWELFCAEDPMAAPLYGGADAAQIFMSYSHADSRFATRLYRELQRHGANCWLDEHDMRAGNRIIDSIDKAIRDCNKVIVCCSQTSLGSSWVKDELRVAQEEERRLGIPIVIPVMLDRFLLDGWDDDLAADLRSRVVVDFINWEKSPQHFNIAFMKLYKALKTPSR